MSTTNGEAAPQRSGFGMRPGWLWTGAVMWLLVLGGLAIAWRSRGDEAGEATSAAFSSAEVGVDSAARAQSDDAPEPLQITIPTSSVGGSDPQVIDLSELMGQAKPAPEVPMWDPAGIEDFAFTNCDGRSITKADLLGKPWAICFVFTKCLGPCPTVTKQLRDLQDRLRDLDFRLVTLTVDPARDTPEALANYARLNGADLDKWYFLTGDQAEIYGLIHRSFKMPVQEVTGPDRMEGFEIIHSTNVMLVDEAGVVQGKFNAAKDTEMAALRRELRSLALPIPSESAVEGDTPVADGRQ